MKKKAKVIYNEEKDQFEVWFLSEGEWLMECAYPCKVSQEGFEPVFIHFSILKRIAKLQNLGYEVKVL